MTEPRNRPPRPGSGEAPHDLRDLFFSRTDNRGIIQAGNTVFQEVSDHPWGDLLGAPHKIIRHDDMPKAVFWILWDTIKKGRPVGAYVKNRARDGLQYWVFALVSPMEDGSYLSVRLKPVSPLLATVETEYAELRRCEKAEGLSAEDSARRLLARLAELGYADYTAFMSHALATELAARSARLGRAPDQRLAQFQIIAKAVDDVAAETEQLSQVFDSIRGIPYNMRILASRLEAAGGPISVISANYGILSDEIAGWMRSFVQGSSGAFVEVRRAIHMALFLQSTALLQDEMTRQFREEPDLPDRIDVAGESRLLRRMTDTNRCAAQDGLKNVVAQAERFSSAVRDMKRLITGLGATRMMCKIEGARLRRGGNSLSGVIEQLDNFQDAIEERLGRIDDQNRLLQRNASALLEESEEEAQAQRKAS